MTIEVDMYPYNEIRDHAFRNCLINEIRIPEGVTSIGKSAFKNCKELRKVHLPSTLQTIGAGAFEGCSSLTRIKIPEGVYDIQKNAFYGCTSLWNVIFPDSVEHIGSNAFRETALYKAYIPLDADIDDNAFPKGNSLYYTAETDVDTIELAKVRGAKVLIIAEGITRIEGNVFQDWDSLNTIILPSTLEYIGDNLFPDKLSHYTVICNFDDPYQITHFGENSFHRTENFIDEDSGEVFPVNRTFIRELVVPVGCIDNYDEHEYLGVGDIIEHSLWAS